MTTTSSIESLNAVIARRIGEQRFRLWFDGKTHMSWEEAVLTVGVANRFYQEWLQKSFAPAVLLAAQELMGESAQVRYVIDPQLFQAQRREEAATEIEKPLAARAAESKPPAKSSSRRWLRMEDFVVGSSNRLAHAAALNLVDQPNSIALTLHGPSGTGKTHLLEGIHGELCKRLNVGDEQVLYVTAEEFTNRFLTGLQSKQSGAFRRTFREAQALLVDDFHFLAGKQSTQVEFLHTFETLRKQGKPVAVACDAHPKMVPALLPELADRLLGGGVWPLTLPDRDTRAGIIMARSTRLGCPLPEDGVWFLADELRGNVRELEGALNTIHHYRQVHGSAVTLDLIREALGDLLKHTSRALQLSDVEQALANVLGLPKKAFHTKDKCRTASYPRMLAIHLARKKTGLPYSEIGRFFGGRSHGTAIAAERKVQKWLADNTPLILGNRRWLIRDLIETVEREMS